MNQQSEEQFVKIVKNGLDDSFPVDLTAGVLKRLLAQERQQAYEEGRKAGIAGLAEEYREYFLSWLDKHGYNDDDVRIINQAVETIIDKFIAQLTSEQGEDGRN
jgi:hypothetical protein